jgi:hypothetical protein
MEHKWFYLEVIWKGPFGKEFKRTGGSLSKEVAEQEKENMLAWIAKHPKLKLINAKVIEGVTTTTK